jgi:hypothetical protein
VNSTVALCKGGAFNAGGTLTINNSRCAAGSLCNELREYTPTIFAGVAKPVINVATGSSGLFTLNGNVGGVRILNLKLNGSTSANGFFFYNGAHDVTMCNLDIDAFNIAVYNESAGTTVTRNIKLTGSKITNSSGIGYLGAGDNAEIAYSYWDGNGSSNSRDHTLYLSAHKPVTNMNVIGNYIHGQFGSTCLGSPIVGHGAFTGLNINYNTVEIDAAAATGGCFGIQFDNGLNPEPVYLRNAVFSGNTIKNGGNTGLTVSNCPNCVIENNLILQDWSYGPGWGVNGISVPTAVARTSPADDVNSGNTIRNNTIWFGPSSNGGATGIKISSEGTGHIVANNTVYYSASSAGQGVNCFSFALPISSFAFINNNHCYSTATFSWVAGRGNLAAWQSYSSSGFDTLSLVGVDPQFKAVGTNFVPDTGSPLLNGGDLLHGSISDIAGNVRPTPPATNPAIGAYEP